MDIDTAKAAKQILLDARMQLINRLTAEYGFLACAPDYEREALDILASLQYRIVTN